MQLSEINKQKWKIASNVKKTYVNVRFLTHDEREMHLISDPEDVVSVYTTIQHYITVLSKSECFTVTEIKYAKDTEYVLAVDGILDEGGFCIKKVKRTRRVLSEEQRKAISDRLHRH